MHHCCQQCLIAEWLGLSVTTRVRVRARAREWGFTVLFFLSATNTFVLHVNGSCSAHGLRTTTVRDVTMMYCKERYCAIVSEPVFSLEIANQVVRRCELP